MRPRTRPKNPIPTYKFHKPIGTAHYSVGGRWVSLGRYNSPEHKSEYERLSAELRATGGRTPAPAMSR